MFTRKKSELREIGMRREFTNESVIIKKSQYMTYAKMVSIIKKNLHGKEVSIEDIEAVQDTRNGHLLLEVKKGKPDGFPNTHMGNAS